MKKSSSGETKKRNTCFNTIIKLRDKKYAKKALEEISDIPEMQKEALQKIVQEN